MKMKPEVKAEWVKALRSGEYRQGTHALRSLTDKFCCLGVLCELAVKAGVTQAPVPSGPSYEYEGAYAVPPASTQEWSGLIDQGPGSGAVSELIGANDRGKTFAEIADMIEEML
jgi:hypothetical protein